ncbi:MAG TPA: tripartite tricarboxylate transporter TctB family protein [Candidatus Binatia bacterium]|jgi:putative tricarboxylic transport membrane protein
MKRSDIAASVILIGLAVFVLFESRNLPFGSMRVPQTGFFPATLAILLLIFSVILLAQCFLNIETVRAADRIAEEGWVRIGATLATMAGFAFALERLGFLLSTFVLMILLLRAIESQSWPKVVAIALATAVVAYAIFGWLLGIPLPVGALGI